MAQILGFVSADLAGRCPLKGPKNGCLQVERRGKPFFIKDKGFICRPLRIRISPSTFQCPYNLDTLLQEEDEDPMLMEGTKGKRKSAASHETTRKLPKKPAIKKKKWPRNPRSLGELWPHLPAAVRDSVFMGEKTIESRLREAIQAELRGYNSRIQKYLQLFTFFTGTVWPNKPKEFFEVQGLLPKPVMDFIYYEKEEAKTFKERWRLEYDILIEKYGYLFPLLTPNVFRKREAKRRPNVRKNRREYRFFSLNR